MKVAFCTYASKCYKYSYADANRYFHYADRLKDSLKCVDFHLFTENNLKHPGHANLPYSFKPYAIQQLRKDYDLKQLFGWIHLFMLQKILVNL